jgi:hypothetical protein
MSVYAGPIIDAHTHPMLGTDDQVGGRPHPPEAYRELVAGSAITRAAALIMAPAGDLGRPPCIGDPTPGTPPDGPLGGA